ncbi:MAG: phosphoglycerate kinase, variant 2 [Marteilia pararefringens]
MEHPFGPLASSPQPSPSPLSATASTAPLVLLENLRFYPEEEASDKSVSGEQVRAFASSLAALADVYVNDAFGTAHRAHASMVAVAECFETRAAGLLMGEELRNFAKVLNGSQSGSVLCIVGGAKVADKIALLNNLLEKCDSMIICGGMAFTFLNVLHHRRIGKSLFDEQSIEEVKRIEEKAKKSGKRLILPVDFVTAKSFDATETFNCEGDIPDDMMGLDCGEKSREIFASAIAESETILWNGPPGVFEKPQFEAGSLAMLKAVCDNKKAVKVAGGGDTTSLVIKYKRESDFDLVSTGGGASLELLEGKTLPGVAALSDIK